MCWKKIINWFNPPPPIYGEMLPATHRALIFSINDYPGTGNDLRGCLNDAKNWEKILKTWFGKFEILIYRDSQVTKKLFENTIKKAVSLLRPEDVLLIIYSGHGTQVFDPTGDESNGYDEALYLHDGAYIDNHFITILNGANPDAEIIVFLDSCFSGGFDRNLDQTQPRFLPLPTHKIRRKVRNHFARTVYEMNWILYSGCEEHQTSADAFIDGQYQGAFTYYALKELVNGMAYKTWFNQIRFWLPNSDFDQKPALKGRIDLLYNRVFNH